MTSKLSIFTVDSFTTTPFTGNPAGVCLLLDQVTFEDSFMQKIATEMNISETAFVTPKAEENEFNLRWFTPIIEVNLCGYATLATAHILFSETRFKSSSKLTFHTLSGPLTVTKSDYSSKLQMNFPQAKPVKVKLTEESIIGLENYLPLQKGEIIETFHCPQTRKLLIEVESFKSIKSLSPNFVQLVNINFGELVVKGIIVTTKGDDLNSFNYNYDFISRYFAPWVGINEDPVTGSAHTVLSVYWGKKLNKKKMLGFQASKRGGDVGVELVENDRVMLEGNEVTVLKGEIFCNFIQVKS